MDELGAAAIRDRVLAAWRAAPDRFREDANAEEDLALGGYRDRAVVELAQNAADAATRAGVPGRLLLRLAETDDGLVLVAANTGAVLDAAGVRALASLRASAKRDEQGVGRFGVGFAAVLALTDAPAVVSHGRGVRFSRADSADLVLRAAHDVPALELELERRGGHVPALRLPFEAEGVAPAGYDTAVILQLRDPAADGGAARDLALRLLDDVGDPLLLALPGLDEVVVEVQDLPLRRVADVRTRWHTRTASGRHSGPVLADRPTEERNRPGWTLTWAVPRGPGVPVPRVVHAPTPTDEPLDWPALLVASFPLEPTRRHVAPGPARNALVVHAASVYTDLLAGLAADGTDVLALVPTGLPAGTLDADLREATLPLLAAAPVLLGVEDGGALRPRDAVALEASGDDEQVLGALAPVLAGLVSAPRSATAALAALGVLRTSLSDVVEALPAHPDPAWWASLYTGLAPVADDGIGREALAWLPAPLADGRVVRGVRGLLLPGPDLDGPDHPGPDRAGADGGGPLAALAAHGLRVVHPDALVHEAGRRLLERLGAMPANARSVLDDPAVRAALDDVADRVEDGAPVEDVADVVDAVLTLVTAATRAGQLRAGELPWLGDLPLPDVEDEPTPAAGLVLAGSPAQRLLDPDEVGELSAGVARRWPVETLEVVGVARSLAVLRWPQVDTTALPRDLLDLDGAQDWAATLRGGSASELAAVRDLDLVDPARRAEALQLLSDDPDLLSAVRDELRVTSDDGSTSRARSYTAWWFRDRLALAGCADPEAEPGLLAVLPQPPAWVAALAPGTRAAIGLPRAWSDLDDEGWTAVLASRDSPGVAALLAMWRALALAADAGDLADLDPPDRLWALEALGSGSTGGSGGTGGRDGTVRVPARDAVVVDAPMWLQRGDVGGLLAVPAGLAEALADVLDLDLAGQAADGEVGGEGSPADVPDAVRLLLPAAPRTWLEHDGLLVDGVRVEWWVEGSGPAARVHASTRSGLAHGLAQASGEWARRAVVETLLDDPASADRVLVEAALDAVAESLPTSGWAGRGP